MKLIEDFNMTMEYYDSVVGFKLGLIPNCEKMYEQARNTGAAFVIQINKERVTVTRTKPNEPECVPSAIKRGRGRPRKHPITTETGGTEDALPRG